MKLSTSLPQFNSLGKISSLLIFCLSICLQTSLAEREDRTPRGTWDLEKLEEAQELAAEDDKAIVFLVGESPKANAKPIVSNSSCPSCSVQLYNTKECPTSKAIDGIIRDLSRNSEIVYIRKDELSELGSFISDQFGKIKNKEVKALVLNPELTSSYGLVNDKDWKKANNNRDRAGEKEQETRCQKVSPE